MADMPDDEEPETLVQKAVKIGLITIPLMMYVSWAHKKFVPCPRVKCQQPRPSLIKRTVPKGKRKNKKGKCQDSRPDKQDRKRGKCENSCKFSRSAKQEHDREICEDSVEPNCQYELSWLCETKEKDTEPSKEKYMDYLKRSTRDCCKSVNNQDKGFTNSKKDCEQFSDTHQHTSKTTSSVPRRQQVKEGNTEADTSSQSNTQSGTISPEAFDKLFEQHFQKCVDEFKQYKQRLEEELESLKEDSESKQKNEKREVNKNGKFLECLADLNLDKDFECDPNFHSTDSDAPYIVKDYKCKATATNGGKSDTNKTNRSGYLECLTDLNMDKKFEEKQETQSYFEEKTVNKRKPDSYNKTKNDDERRITEKDPCAWETQDEELWENDTACSEFDSKGKVKDNNIYTKAKLDDCGCDPHFDTKDTDKYGIVKGEPSEYRSVKEDNTDDDALKDFWHACGPPKGLRRGCQAEGCNDPCDKQK